MSVDWCKGFLSDSDLQEIQTAAQVNLSKAEQEKLSEVLGWYIRRLNHLDALRPNRKEKTALTQHVHSLRHSADVLYDFFRNQDGLTKQLFHRVMIREHNRQSSERSKMADFPYVFQDVSTVLSELKLSLDEEMASIQIDNGGREAENAARDELFFRLSEIFLGQGGLQKNIDQFITPVCAKLPPDICPLNLNNATIVQAINRHKKETINT